MQYTINKNHKYNSVEITFDEKPSEAIRAALRGLRFRWHSVKHVWYGYAAEEAVKAAIESSDGEAVAEEKSETNDYGVSVGDIFSASWGYEQTNVNFFQVVKLCGKFSVRVREVYLPLIDEKPTCPMAADRTYKVVRDMLPASSHTVFIKNQETGDLKRLFQSECNGKKCVYFNASSFASAHKVEGDTTTEYESWYA